MEGGEKQTNREFQVDDLLIDFSRQNIPGITEESGPEAEEEEEEGWASPFSWCSETGLYADIFPNPALSA